MKVTKQQTKRLPSSKRSLNTFKTKKKIKKKSKNKKKKKQKKILRVINQL